MWHTNPLSLGKSSVFLSEVTPNCESLHLVFVFVFLNEMISVPLLSVRMMCFLSFGGKPRFTSFLVFSRGNYSIYSCNMLYLWERWSLGSSYTDIFEPKSCISWLKSTSKLIPQHSSVLFFPFHIWIFFLPCEYPGSQ